MKKLILLLCLLCTSGPLRAYDVFHPEADETLKNGSTWTEVSFKEGSTNATTVFRAWIPYKPADAWLVWTDTNAWKQIHSDYTDSRTLDKNQFDLVAQKSPSSIKDCYDLVGGENFSSTLGRHAGQVWTSYVLQRFNLPWPLADRWNVMKVKNDETKSGSGMYKYDYKTVAGNFKDLKGYWELIPIPNKPGWTEFRGEYSSDPGIAIPHFLAKKIFRASMERSVKEKMKVLDQQGATKAAL